jgi:hypothetical protein
VKKHNIIKTVRKYLRELSNIDKQMIAKEINYPGKPSEGGWIIKELLKPIELEKL